MHSLAQHRHHVVMNLPALAVLAEAARHLRGQTQPVEDPPTPRAHLALDSAHPLMLT